MAVKFKQSSVVGSLSITPLIDVVFLLLIFFLVATQFEENDRELAVELPDAEQSLPLTEEPKILYVNIDQEGRYFVSGRVRTLSEVESLVREAVANNPLTQSVMIRADRRVQLDSFVAAVDLCKKHGVTYALQTEGQ